MRAVVKNSAERGFQYVTDYPDPKPTDAQVVIEVAAASLCGTDREVYEWTPSAQAFNLDLPVVTGHEVAGTIIEVGAGVTNLQVGDRVALESHLTCGQCFPCRTGDAHTCERTGISACRSTVCSPNTWPRRRTSASSCPITPPWKPAPCSRPAGSPCTRSNGPATPSPAAPCWSGAEPV